MAIVILLSFRILTLTIPDRIGAYQSHAYAPNGPWIMQDFRDTVWLPIHYLWYGGNPYETSAYLRWAPANASGFFLYTPAIMTLMMPLAALKWSVAASAWTIFDLLIAFWIAWYSVQLANLPKRVDAACAIAALLLLWLPTQLAFQTGNPSMLVIGAAVFVLGRRRNDWLTAVGLAVCMLKVQFGVPMIVLLLAIRLWRPVLRAVGIVVLLSLPTTVLAVRNAGSVSAFWHSLVTNLDAQRASAYGNLTTPGAYRWDLAGIIGRLTGINLRMDVQILLVSVILIIGSWNFGRAVSSRHEDLTFAIGSLTVMLCLFHNRYDFVICFPAAIMLAQGSIRDIASTVASRVARGVIAALILGVGYHPYHIDQVLSISPDFAQDLNGIAILTALLACVVLLLRSLETDRLQVGRSHHYQPGHRRDKSLASSASESWAAAALRVSRRLHSAPED
ncbi:MAG TPA: glycosyltransferase family 87 protein [Streptosporangiaceae bacterium]|nr:glycosyltransferase family 87 protein [Streptosporangiaceae bacterium]